MTEPNMAAPRPADQTAWDLLIDDGARFAINAIDMWASTTKRLIATEAGGVMAVAIVTAATGWFDWAKAWQEVPYLGGAGRPGPMSLTPAGP